MFIEVMALIGMITVLIVGGVMAAVFLEFVIETIDDLKYKYRYKHRFDKPPTAKCYCFDCEYHNNESNRCYRFHENTNRRTADNWFCYEATPRKRSAEVKE